MSSKKGNQLSIKKKIGWSNTSQASFPNKEDHDFDLNEDLDVFGHNEEYDILEHNEKIDEEFHHGEPSTRKKRKMKVKREFCDQWETKYKWLREAKHKGKTVMKCIYCEMHKAMGPWGIGTGCSTL